MSTYGGTLKDHDGRHDDCLSLCGNALDGMAMVLFPFT